MFHELIDEICTYDKEEENINPKYNIKPMIEDFQSQIGKDGGLDGWNIDLLALIEEIYRYTQTLEERIEKLEENK